MSAPCSPVHLSEVHNVVTISGIMSSEFPVIASSIMLLPVLRSIRLETHVADSSCHYLLFGSFNVIFRDNGSSTQNCGCFVEEFPSPNICVEVSTAHSQLVNNVYVMFINHDMWQVGVIVHVLHPAVCASLQSYQIGPKRGTFIWKDLMGWST